MLNQTPMISCCITSYRHLDGIYKSIDSIIMQDYPQIELAVFDDGTEQFPIDKIIDYINNHKGENIKNVIVHTNESNVGTVRNLNGLLAAVQGEYIIEIGADDELYNSSTCERIVKGFFDSKADILTSYRTKKKDGRLYGITPSKSNASIFAKANAGEQFKWIAMGAPLAGAGTYYRRAFLKRIGGFDEEYRLQEDGPIFLHATREGTKIHFLEEVTFVYAQGEGVSSGEKNNPILMQDVKKMFEKEIFPYLERFSLIEKRRVKYGYERALLDEEISFEKRLKLFLKYIDVYFYRRKFTK
ncbi:glycosyltransferase family 2 protein [Pseudobutyrivibrio xylanivorans]|uniref:Glycosyltransferase like family 2 n=1 Tax=Pseudobutyrivibrio xylanivorans DSM 14809 TaxID=1123012 RepID=A0A1M6KNT8_PSEXY|nr:glycosyltransferase [Pseudobutyrivibrio xylanivorans]SHJ60595.1 Glycosyltransferase like family 2 [Pseudobutyrivibrio xylanivorans DSM 14809]